MKREAWEREAITPSWEVFDACPRCDAKAGEPCLSMRGVPKGWVPNREHQWAVTSPLANPHHGRKKIKK